MYYSVSSIYQSFYLSPPHQSIWLDFKLKRYLASLHVLAHFSGKCPEHNSKSPTTTAIKWNSLWQNHKFVKNDFGLLMDVLNSYKHYQYAIFLSFEVFLPFASFPAFVFVHGFVLLDHMSLGLKAVDRVSSFPFSSSQSYDEKEKRLLPCQIQVNSYTQCMTNMCPGKRGYNDLSSLSHIPTPENKSIPLDNPP